jgi:hypothetical protein
VLILQGRPARDEYPGWAAGEKEERMKKGFKAWVTTVTIKGKEYPDEDSIRKRRRDSIDAFGTTIYYKGGRCRCRPVWVEFMVEETRQRGA